MITKIRKRDGREIYFAPEKITRAIFLAASKVAEDEGQVANYATAEQLTDQVVNYLNRHYQDGIPTVEEIQDAVVKILIECGHAKTSEAYILYRAERSRIRNMKTRLMQSIREITFSDSKDADVKRENANIDGNTAMGTMLQYGSAVSREFCKANLMTPKFAKLHDDGDIHIHDMDFMNMGTLTCCQIPLDKLFEGGFSTGHGHLREPQSITSYAALAAIAIQSNQNDQHGGQSIPAFDYYLAEGVAKTFRRAYTDNVNKALEVLISLDEDIKADMEQVEKESGERPTLRMSEKFLAAMDRMLAEKHGLDAQQIDLVNAFAYKEAQKETEKLTYQAMEGFVHNLNTMHSRAGAQIPFSSLNYGTDTSPEGRLVIRNLLLATEAGLGNGETAIFPIHIFKVKEGVNFNPGDPNYDLFKLACKVSAERLFPNFSFIDAPFNLKYYKPGHPETEATYMGCRTRVVGNVYDPSREIVNGRGNLSFPSINLPRLAIKANHNIDFFFEQLDQQLNLVIDQLNHRFKIQCGKKVKNFPFLMGQGVWIDSDKLGPDDSIAEIIKHGTLSMGFIGLAECLKALMGSHHGESVEAQKMGLQIVGYMRKRMDEKSRETGLNWTLLATPAEGLSGRFVRLDKQKYGIIPGVTDREYYTNSFHVPVYYNINAFDKIKIEGPYHELTNAGHISYIELDGDPCKNLDAFEQVVRCMKENGIGYGSINHPVDRDPVCGYTGVIDNECPYCGRKEEDDDVGFERIRRITGYLVGTMDMWNDAKTAEEKDRVKHL